MGGALGADQLAEAAARIRGHEVVVVRPDWHPGGTYNPRAGFERNTVMLDMEPVLVIAFWVGVSRGTRDTIRKAMKRGIATEIHWRPA